MLKLRDHVRDLDDAQTTEINETFLTNMLDIVGQVTAFVRHLLFFYFIINYVSKIVPFYIHISSYVIITKIK